MFNSYPDTFQKARRLQRKVTLFVGPPNSGKTHAAFERLAHALDGALHHGRIKLANLEPWRASPFPYQRRAVPVAPVGAPPRQTIWPLMITVSKRSSRRQPGPPTA